MMDFGDRILNATSSVSFSDENGVRYEVTADRENPYLVLEPLVMKRQEDGAQVKLRIKNVAGQSLFLHRAAVIDVAAGNNGILDLGDEMAAWTLLQGETLADFCNEWFEYGKSDFYCPSYAIIGNRTSGRYVTLGFLGFARQDVSVELKAARTPFKFQRLKALCDFGRYPLAPGEGIDSETLYVNWADPPLAALNKYADLVLGQIKEKPRFKNIVGWSAWDYYLSDITEDDVIENAKWLAEHRDELPVEYIQLDHGFEKHEGDWLITNEKFPHGLKWLAETIRQYGFKPGLWLCPFLVAPQSQLFRDHPSWVIKNEAGNPLEVTGYAVPKVYALDCSIPQACEWLKDLAASVTREYGYAYVKLDGANTQGLSPQGVLADNRMSKAEALQKGLRSFRQGLTKDAILLAADEPMFGLSVGIVDALRIGLDVGARWDASKLDKHHGERDNYPGPGFIRRGIAASANKYVFHRKFWVTDPDFLIVRQQGCRSELTYEEAQSWASVVGLSNGLVMLGDKMPELDANRIELLTKVLPHYCKAARPVDFFVREVPAILDLEVKSKTEAWHVICVTNTERPERKRDYPIAFTDLGLSEKRAYHVFDFWRAKYLGTFTGSFTARALPPHHCMVLCLRQDSGVPQVLSTDMHITQGGIEIERSVYDPPSKTLTVQTLACGKRGHLYLFVPKGLSMDKNGERLSECIYRTPVHANGEAYKLTLNGPSR